MARTRIGAAILICVATAACPDAASAQIVLGDATSRIDLWCNSAHGANGDFAEPVSSSCEGHPTQLQETGTTRGTVSTSFADVLMVSASTECVACPFGPSTFASSRILFQLVVDEHTPPPHSLASVPVQIVTEGEVGISVFGYAAGGGTYLSSTLQEFFTNADMFVEDMNTLPSGLLHDDYATTATLPLLPGHVYFGNVVVGCNQFSSQMGSWTCGAQVSAHFALDQAAFDASQGEQSFDLAQYFAIARSPNLVPEASAGSLAAAALGALALLRRRRCP